MKDRIQQPVDVAYEQGIQSMGRQGTKVSAGEWLEAIARMLALPLSMGLRMTPGGSGVRLYRGEGRHEPIWNNPEINKVSGRWYSTDKAFARSFAEDAKRARLGPGRLLSVDVPGAVQRRYAIENQPQFVPFTFGGKEPGVTVLPREWAQFAKELERLP